MSEKRLWVVDVSFEVPVVASTEGEARSLAEDYAAEELSNQYAKFQAYAPTVCPRDLVGTVPWGGEGDKECQELIPEKELS